MTDSKKKQKIAADPSLVHAAQPGHSTATKLIDGSACNTNIENLYKFRNGKGDMLKTPKRSSIARALALLAPSPLPAVCDLTITGSNWPVAAVVTTQRHASPLAPCAAYEFIGPVRDQP